MKYENPLPFTSSFSMTPEDKQKWIDALRSGKYEQARGGLVAKPEEEDEFRFCCLGVLEACVAQTNPSAMLGATFPFTDAINAAVRHSYRRQQQIFDTSLEIDLYSVFTNEHGWIPLWKLNDKHHYTFNQIADVIEATVETH